MSEFGCVRRALFGFFFFFEEANAGGDGKEDPAAKAEVATQGD